MIKINLWIENTTPMYQYHTTAKFIELACLVIFILLAQETALDCLQLVDRC